MLGACLVFLLSLTVSWATEDSARIAGSYLYERPQWTTFMARQPADLKEFWKLTFRRESALTLTAVAAGTGLLIAYDQMLYEKSYALGDRLKISHEGQQRAVLQLDNPFIKDKKLTLLGLPRDLGTALYFIGDGWLHAAITVSFLAYGLSAEDNRALQTASQLAEAILANGIVVQILKHTTGRETPNAMEAPGGKWRFFPNQKDYHRRVNKYDAFPSGHVPTAFITMSIIGENYPEYKFIYPLGYTLLGALAFQMVNNGVHWWSDYPVTIYMGMTFAQIAISHGRTPLKSSRGAGAFGLEPTFVGNRLGLQAFYRF